MAFLLLGISWVLLALLPTHAVQLSDSQRSLDFERFDAGKETLPKGYQPKLFKTQIARYRAVYDKLFKSYPNFKRIPKDIFTDLHVEGLFEIFKDGVAAVNDYIVQRPHQPGSEIALRRLSTLFKKAVRLNNEGEMSQHVFLCLNIYLALIIDEFKGIKTTPAGEEGLRQLDTATFAFFKIMDSDLWWTAPRNPFIKIFHPPMVLYSVLVPDPSKKQGFSIHDIIDQRFQADYGSGLLLFSVHSKIYEQPAEDSVRKKKLGSKQSPHFGRWDGTYNMLRHDYLHNVEQNKMEWAIKEGLKLDWKGHLDKIYFLRETMDPKSNKYKIISNGLFILSHELFNVMAYYLNLTNNYEEILGAVKNLQPRSFRDMILIIKQSMMEVTWLPREAVHSEKNRVTGYKVTHRDHEFILKGNVTDTKGKPLWVSDWADYKSHLPQDRDKRGQMKSELVRDGYGRFWDTFLNILDEAGMDIDTIDQGSTRSLRKNRTLRSHNEMPPSDDGTDDEYQVDDHTFESSKDEEPYDDGTDDEYQG